LSDSLLVRGGRVVDATGERTADVRVEDGVVTAVGPGLDGDRVLDAAGCVVAPGLVDLHAHLREPGHEEAETIESGARAAALGGYTAVVAMPNTEPPLDDPAVVAAVLATGAKSVCDVHVAGCITKGREGTELAPMGELHALGVRLFTDDGACVESAGMMRRALEYAHSLSGTVVAQHAEDPSLCAGGHMHEGEWSSRLGIAGRPTVAESSVVARDCLLVELTGTPLHVLHISTAQAIDVLRDAKRRGLPVTAEVAPHHFTLTDAACASFDPAFKVHPPLRSADDVEAVKRGLADGTIDAIATDHAPHAVETKECSFEEAPPGMLGLETALALTLTELVAPGVLGLADALALLSWRPAAIAGLTEHGGPVAPGRPAHLVVVDPASSWTVEPSRLASRARNTPYAGRTLTGRVRHTLLGGEAVVVDGEAQR
jgi:dihydroorotase